MRLSAVIACVGMFIGWTLFAQTVNLLLRGEQGPPGPAGTTGVAGAAGASPLGYGVDDHLTLSGPTTAQQLSFAPTLTFAAISAATGAVRAPIIAKRQAFSNPTIAPHQIDAATPVLGCDPGYVPIAGGCNGSLYDSRLMTSGSGPAGALLLPDGSGGTSCRTAAGAPPAATYDASVTVSTLCLRVQ